MSSLRLALKQSLEEAAPPIQTKNVEPKQEARSKNDRKRKRKIAKDRSGSSRGRESKKRKQVLTSMDLMRKINSSSVASLGGDSHGRKGSRSGRSYLSGQSSSNDSHSSDEGDSDSSSSSDESSNVHRSRSDSDSDSSSSGSSSDSDGRENDSGSDGDDDRADEDMEGVFDSERTSDEDDSPSRKRSKSSRRYRNHHEKYSEDSEEVSTEMSPDSFQITKSEKKHSKGHSSSSPVSRSRNQSPVPTTESQSHKHLSSTSSASHKRSIQSSAQSIASSSSKKEKRSTSSIASSKKKEKEVLKKSKKNVRKQKTVPPPNPHVLAWVMGMSVEKQRRKISPGMRVKVRFVNPSLQWYGGVITAVSSKGDRVKIKYDDGTKEKSKFPDKEIIVDADGNGEHSSDVQVLVQSFRPKVMGVPFGTVPLSIKKKKLKTKGDDTNDGGQKKMKGETSGSRQDVVTNVDPISNKSMVPSSKKDSIGVHKNEKHIASVSKVKTEDKSPSNITQSFNAKEKVTALHVQKDPIIPLSIPIKGSSSNILSEKSDTFIDNANRKKNEMEKVYKKSNDEIIKNSKSDDVEPNVSKSKDYTTKEKGTMLPPLISAKKSSPVKESPKSTLGTKVETLAKDEAISNSVHTKSHDIATYETPSLKKSSSTASASLEASSESNPTLAIKDKPQPSASKIPSPQAMASAAEKNGHKMEEATNDNDNVSEEDDSQKKSLGRGRKANRKSQTKPISKDDRLDGETKIKKKKEREDERKGKGDKKEDVEDWVQCDICSKWRLIPSVKDLPEKWYCELNVTDPKRSFCSAPEQTPEEVARERRKAKKASRKVAGTAGARSTSPAAVPKKSTSLQKIREDVDEAPEKKRSSPNILGKSLSEDSIDNLDSSVKKRKSRSDASLEEENSDNDASNQNRRGKRGRRSNEEKAAEGRSKRGRKPKEEKQQEWVQCEKCEKWRRLPRHISAKDLPDQWYCSMNDWDPRSASCAVQEDYKVEEEKIKENTILTNNSQGGSAGGSKLTYRNLIRRPTRPISERMRATESIFSSHAAEVDGEQSGAPPVVLYANSSMFHQRQPYHNRPSNLQEQQNSLSSISLFELMSHSQLWKTLYNDFYPTHNNKNSQDKSDTLPSSSKADEMKAMIYHAMGTRELATSDILLECQCRYWDRDEWATLRATVTHDDVVSAVNGLVKDGLVQEITSAQNGNDDTLMDTFSPTRYRRCKPFTSEEDNKTCLQQVKTCQESLQHRYGSRQMKFSKPWKKLSRV